MESNTDSTLPSVLSRDLLVYQNRQLSRLVRELRVRSADLRGQPTEGSLELSDEVDRLRSSNTALYARLNKLESELVGLKTNLQPDIRTSSPNGDPVAGGEELRECGTECKAEKAMLLSEISRLNSVSAIRESERPCTPI